MNNYLNKLNIGCGLDIREGWINLDSVKLPGVNVVHDLNNLPLPFENDFFDLILCKDILEHIKLVDVLRDIHRIMKTGGKLIIQVPHFTSKDAFSDPTHKNFFTVHTFRYFTSEHYRSYYFDYTFSKLEKVYIKFDKRLMYFYNYILEPFININIRIQNFYEGTPLRIFPATNLEIHMIK